MLTKLSICVFAVIIAIAIIPKYVKLPASLELLFKDKIGQILLLVLALAIGSYNFICGVLIALLFLSITIQLNTPHNIEGFDNSSEDEDEYEADYSKESFEENEDIEKETNKSMNNKNTKTNKTNKTNKKTVKTLPPMEDKESKSDMLNSPKETEPPSDLTIKNLEEELKTSQDEIKNLELKLNQLQKTNKTDTSIPMMTLSPDSSTSKLESNPDFMKEIQTNPDLAKAYLDSLKSEMGGMPTPTPMIEGFGCGCSGSSSDNSRRETLIKYIKQNNDDDTIEPFTSKMVSDDSSPYDVVGCKYDTGYKAYSDTYHGPPVASCQAYTKIKVDQTGTVFYPLN